MMTVWTIITAGGIGKRFSQQIPKQYLTLNGAPILHHTLVRFQKAQIVNEIVLVVGSDYLEQLRGSIIENHRFSKVKFIVEGGKQRQDSVYSGLKRIWNIVDDNDIIIVHDAVRPLIDQKSIKRCVMEANDSGACILGTRINDTLKTVNKELIINHTMNKKEIWAAQTPQAFKAMILKQAFIKAEKEIFYGTDEASLVERLPYPVKIVPGPCWNIKITFPEDLTFAEQIIDIISE